MEKKDITPKTREQIFKEKADTYSVCYSTACPLREHCLHSILSAYTPQDRMLVQSVNLTNPEMQREGCPWFRNDEPIRMPFGLSTMYYDMPGRIERAIKNHLIHVYSRKRYYEYHNASKTTAGPKSPPSMATSRITCGNHKNQVIFLFFLE